MRFKKLSLQKMTVWIPLAAAITLLSGLIYIVSQQQLRLSANDPQIQLAEDIAVELSQGISPAALVGQKKIDISQSLAPYIIIFDLNGRPIAGSGRLGGTLPQVPQGVFDYVLEHQEDRITWEPQFGVRSAVVVTKYARGFVLVGRSLKEIERREVFVQTQVEIIWFITMLTTLAITLLYPSKKQT